MLDAPVDPDLRRLGVGWEAVESHPNFLEIVFLTFHVYQFPEVRLHFLSLEENLEYEMVF